MKTLELNPDFERLKKIREDLSSKGSVDDWPQVARLRSEALLIIGRISPELGSQARMLAVEPNWVQPEPDSFVDSVAGGISADFKRRQRHIVAARANDAKALSASSDLIGILDDAIRYEKHYLARKSAPIHGASKSDDIYFGQWRLVSSRPLGKGGQGHTNLVEKENPYTVAVIKRLNELEGGVESKAIERFRQEIDITQSLRHPSVLRVLDHGEENGRPWLVTEYLNLGSVHDHLSALRGDMWRVLRIARDVANALSAAHVRKIIHRDIKPQNILLRTLTEPVVGDFGIAHVEEGPQLTDTGERVGANWFRPPEAEVGRIDSPCPSFDVYSLGKVIYTCLSGGEKFRQQRYCDSDTNLTKLLAQPRLEKVNEHLLSKMIVEDPAGRFQSMGEVIEAIDNLL